MVKETTEDLETLSLEVVVVEPEEQEALELLEILMELTVELDWLTT